jgi:hypothetical protein
MTVMLLALMFSDAALNSSEAGEYRLVENHEPEAEPRSRTRRWTPGVQSWTIEKTDCPAFFQRQLEGFGIFRVGPRCADEEMPYAL